MVLRNIVRIDEEKCNGCGLCMKIPFKDVTVDLRGSVAKTETINTPEAYKKLVPDLNTPEAYKNGDTLWLISLNQ